MSEQTAISWCDSTVNFWQGCTKVSPACDHCYAERRNRWLHKGENWGPGAPRLLHITAGYTVRSWQRNAEKFRRAHGRDRRVFVNSTSDWLDNEAPIDWLITLLDTVRQSPDVTFLLLTKRIGNWRKRMSDAWEHILASAVVDMALVDWIEAWTAGTPPAHVWLGATVVTQEEADRDIPKLLAVPARVRFLSIEPMLGPVDLERVWLTAPQTGWVNWVICGGESGPQARPMHPDWVRSLRDQCAAAGVPFHFKQWGEWQIASTENGHFDSDMARNTAHWVAFDGSLHKPSSNGLDNPWAMVRVGTKASGRLLDGAEHNGFPA